MRVVLIVKGQSQVNQKAKVLHTCRKDFFFTPCLRVVCSAKKLSVAEFKNGSIVNKSIVHV